VPYLLTEPCRFRYLTGYNVADVSLLINIDTAYSVLLVRRKSQSEIIFDGGVEDFEGIPDVQILFNRLPQLSRRRPTRTR